MVEPKTRPRQFVSLMCHKRDQIPTKLRELAELIGKRDGVKITLADAVRVAVTEAIERRRT